MSKSVKIAIGAVTLVIVVGGGYLLSAGKTGLFQGRFSLEQIDNIQLDNDKDDAPGSLEGPEHGIANRLEKVELINLEDSEERFEPGKDDKTIKLKLKEEEDFYADINETGLKTLEKPLTGELAPEYQIKNPGTITLDPKFLTPAACKPGPVKNEEINTVKFWDQTKTYVSGSTDIQAICFGFKEESCAGPVYIDEITLKRTASSEVTGSDIDTFSLKELDGQTTAQVSRLTNDTITFDKFSGSRANSAGQYEIPAYGKSEHCMEIGTVDQNVHTRDADNSGSASLSFEIASVKATDSNGQAVKVRNSFPVKGDTLSFIGTSGVKLSANVSSSTPSSKIITPNNPEVVIAMDLTANGDQIYVDEMEFEVDLDDSQGVITEERKSTNTIYKSELVGLNQTGTVTQVLTIAPAKFSQSGSRITTKFDQINNQLLVKSSAKVGVRITAYDINSTSDSGTQIRLQPVAGSIKARSKSTGTSLPQSSIILDLGKNDNGNLSDDQNTGNLFVVRRAAPGFSVTKTNGNLTLNSMNPVMEFTVKANEDKLQIARLSPALSGLNVSWPTATNDWKIYSGDQVGGSCPNLQSAQFARTITVSKDINNQTHFDFTTPDPISKGQTKCYLIEAKITDTNPAASVHAASIQLPTDQAIAYQDTIANHRSNNPFIIWSDDPRGVNDTPTDMSWINGFAITGLPSTTVVLQNNPIPIPPRP